METIQGTSTTTNAIEHMASVIKPKPIPHALGFRSVILDSQQLGKQPYLKHLQDLINVAYQRAHNDTISPERGGVRIVDPADLATEIGRHGRCCLVFRQEDEHMLKPVAVAMIKYFNEDLGTVPVRSVDANGFSLASGSGGSDGSDGSRSDSPARSTSSSNIRCEGYKKEPTSLLDIEHWEPACVAIDAEDPSLRRLGLAAHCVAELERDLLERLHATESQNREHGKDGDGQQLDVKAPSSSRNLTFWIRATTRSNAPYWQRRGYSPVRVDWYPPGFWGSYQGIDVMTLKKEVPRLSVP
ncbi:hypothetical protein VTO42DRAFT_845 [Malbranchea cinnamomea]